MKTVHAIYEKGVFPPIEAVDFPENAAVEFEPRLIEPTIPDVIKKVAETDPGLLAIYEILSRRHSSGRRDTAERHNEHQP
jgi:predicted DNA-binding antitoxin AbrB/MazE fold protein